MSAEPPTKRPMRWTRVELTGLLIVVWVLALLLFCILTVKG